MLQQTQVTTVIPYFERFMAHFPTLASLAAASQAEVLHLWAGLGYYARGRNLHRAAQILVQDYAGEFPQELVELRKLPGLGRSTASAILAICYAKPHPILDGNVKRVLARYQGLEGYPGDPKIEPVFWRAAEQLLPSVEIPAYTQAIMDLGALICLRKNPACERCPVMAGCVAHASGRTAELPYPRPKKAYPTQYTWLSVLLSERGVWLTPRPETGIWGGLWSLPEAAAEREVLPQAPVAGKQRWQLAPREHLFTHYRLIFTPVITQVAMDFQPDMLGKWVPFSALKDYALPAPIKRLLMEGDLSQ